MAIVIGMFSFGFVEQLAGTMRNSILALMVYFVIAFYSISLPSANYQELKTQRSQPMKLYTIDTGLFKLDGGAMFGVVPKSIWNKLNPADENNMCTWAMRCLLIEDRKPSYIDRYGHWQ